MYVQAVSDSVSDTPYSEAMAMSLYSLSVLISVKGSRIWLNTRTAMRPSRKSSCCFQGDMSATVIDAVVKYGNNGHIWKTQKQVNGQMIHRCPKL